MSLLDAPVGCVPIIWNNADVHNLAPETPAATVLDEITRLGFAGTQHGRGLPEGDVLKAELAARDLRFAELYCELPAGPDGLADPAADLARRDLGRLIAGGGEVLVVAIHAGGQRDQWAGRATDGAPRWPAPAFDRLADLLTELAALAPEGVKVAYHPHVATWVETPDEVDALADRLPATGAGLCMDVGHFLAGGGDPVDAIGRYGPLITHVHVKDVDSDVLARVRTRDVIGLGDAVRNRIFTELGRGALDLDGVLRGLDRIGYDGWLMVEQDSSWLRPAEAAAIGRRVLEYARRVAVREKVA